MTIQSGGKDGISPAVIDVCAPAFSGALKEYSHFLYMYYVHIYSKVNVCGTTVVVLNNKSAAGIFS